VLSDFIEVKTFEGQGFQPLVSYGSWRVAALRFLDEIAPDRIDSMERHKSTDEVFVLVNGNGMLLLGGNDSNITYPQCVEMKIGDVYNVKRNTWHTIVLSRNAKVILVENENTGSDNTDYLKLDQLTQQSLQSKAHEFLRKKTGTQL
jgi:mannose-6-phosphate isomerase-like protein (cupin superfamily)